MAAAESLSSEQIKEASSKTVFNATGEQVRLGDLIGQGKVVLVAIRHFHCGLCQQYVAEIAAKIKPESLGETKLIFLGCGDWKLITPYSRDLGSPFPMYANPDTSVYKALGMTYRNVKRDATSESVDLSNSPMASVWKAIGRLPSWGFRSPGPVTQNGGEIVFVDGQATFAHQMKTTSDHISVDELIKVAGLSL